MRPTKIKVLGQTFTINYVTGVPLDEDDLGECSVDTLTISVRDGLSPEKERLVLTHELVHAIEDVLGLKLREKQVEGLETGLYALIRDNPSFISYLRKG